MKIDSCIYAIEVELNKLKKLSKIKDTTKEDLYKQIREIKWKIFLMESYIEIKKGECLI